jgi:hypothetical protein
MSAILPNGSILEIAATFSAAKAVTAITNANPAVATAAAHGLADGDVIVVASGWTRLNDKVARVADSDTGTFELEGINTTNTVVYTAGAGTGSVRSVSGWAQISQITGNTSSGGEQQFTTFGFLEESDDRQLPTTKSPISMSITVADDPDLPYVAVVEAADDDRASRAATDPAERLGDLLQRLRVDHFDPDVGPQQHHDQNHHAVAGFAPDSLRCGGVTHGEDQDFPEPDFQGEGRHSSCGRQA